MKKDAAEFARRCDKYQHFSFYMYQVSPWDLELYDQPMTICSIGDRHHRSTASRKRRRHVCSDHGDYFTKWVEAELMAAITSKKMQSFVWRFFICRYGIPQKLVSDNGKQFDSDEFKNFCNSSVSSRASQLLSILNPMAKSKKWTRPWSTT